ncbi:MAG TPA: DUF192 domain-containing protein [Nitrospira sp.]|nr:DUF192 domain-containing protein [Candidatus Manganitrophaceae bacterium]
MPIMWRKERVLIAVAFFLAINPAYANEAPSHQTVTFPSGTQLNAEIADTPKTRRLGLMFREHLPEGGGMLFVFQVAARHRFWMKNCKFPIDIIWMNEHREIVYISENTPPCKSDPCPSYGPTKDKALYVLEVAAGLTHQEKLKKGMIIQFQD